MDNSASYNTANIKGAHILSSRIIAYLLLATIHLKCQLIYANDSDLCMIKEGWKL